MTDISDWPIVLTNRCADACAEAFALGDRQKARAWLTSRVSEHGTITDQLPPPLAGRRSPSGFFLLIDDTLILPLAHDRDDQFQWIATHCIAFPSSGPVDPFRLHRRDLLDNINLLPHAIERFQQRGGGHPHPPHAARELLDTIAPTVRAAAQPPTWCSTRPADFYLIAGTHGEYCLPCRAGSGARPFDVTTCIHRASHLFELNPTLLFTMCQLHETQLPPGGRNAQLISNAFRWSGRLTWHKPSWARPHPHATWWIVFHNRMASPVAYQPDIENTPLLILGLADHRPLLIRLLSRLRRTP